MLGKTKRFSCRLSRRRRHPSVYERRWCSVQFILPEPARVAKQADSRVTVSAAFAAGEC